MITLLIVPLLWLMAARRPPAKHRPTSRLAALAQVREMTASGEAKRIRLESGLSLSEVAPEIPVGTPTLFRWEEGQRRPRGDPALAYLRILLELRARLTPKEGVA